MRNQNDHIELAKRRMQIAIDNNESQEIVDEIQELIEDMEDDASMMFIPTRWPVHTLERFEG